MADTSKLTITNTAEGPRGFWEGAECILLDPEQSATADLTEAEAKAARATGYFKVAAVKAGTVREEGPQG